jgi:hypothetical protein
MAGAAMEKEMAEEPGVARAEPAPSAPRAAEESTTAKPEAGPEAADTEEAIARRLTTQAVLQTRPPELLARVDKPDLEPLPLVAQDVTVIVAGHRVRVVLDMVFRNPSSSQLAGTLMVALPDRASPCELGTFQGAGIEAIPEGADAALYGALITPAPSAPEALLGQDIELSTRWAAKDETVDWGTLRQAVVVEPVRGRQVYEEVTRARVDPALAEWSGSGSYSARIFPIPAGGLKRVVLAYDQTLVPSGGRILFPLPLPDSKAAIRRLTVLETTDPHVISRLASSRRGREPSEGGQHNERS